MELWGHHQDEFNIWFVGNSTVPSHVKYKSTQECRFPTSLSVNFPCSRGFTHLTFLHSTLPQSLLFFKCQEYVSYAFLCTSAFSFLGVWVLCPVSLYSGLPQTPIWRCRQGPVLLYMPIFDLIISYQVLCQNRFYFFAVYVFETECSTTMTDCFVRVLFLCAFSPLIELFALKIELHKRKKK